MSTSPGTLYIVATPIGNLDDISRRALDILQGVDLIAAEDTRHSKTLLAHYGINARLMSYHDFNEREIHTDLVERLKNGTSIALISDAGTPLINDPGYRLVKSAHAAGICVVPIPGPSALISAMSVAGLPTDKFIFEGYAPERTVARLRCFESLKSETRTIAFYETPHRIRDFLNDALAVFGPDRPLTLAREMTKKFESIHSGTIASVFADLTEQRIPEKGEFVVVIQGAEEPSGEISAESEKILYLLMTELPLKKAAALTAQITGVQKNRLYQKGLEQQER